VKWLGDVLFDAYNWLWKQQIVVYLQHILTLAGFTVTFSHQDGVGWITRRHEDYYACLSNWHQTSLKSEFATKETMNKTWASHNSCCPPNSLRLKRESLEVGGNMTCLL